MNTLCFIDIETTGLDPLKHEIIEIGAVKVSGEELSLRVRPEFIVTADPQALQKNGYDESLWSDAISLKDALTQLNEFAGTCRLAGWNIAFDWSFLIMAFIQHNLQPKFHYQKLDILSLAYFILPLAPGHSLREVCEFLGIPPEPAVHRAINGARCIRDVCNTLKAI